MEFTWMIGAEAGAGSMVTGRTLAKVFARGGYHVIGYPEYPSLIRGGHNTYQIRLSDTKIHSPVKKNDVVVSLNRNGIIFNRDSINKGGVLIYDSEMDVADVKMPEGVNIFPVPLKQIVEQNGLDPRMANTITVGISLGLIDYPMEDFFHLLEKEFSRKSKEIVDLNIKAAKAGYDYVKKNFKGHFPIKFKTLKNDGKKIAAYPMTPASSVLHYLAEKERDFNIVVKQTEDEIAAVEYAIGAAYAGVRAGTSTSGGGFSLMVESLGLSALSETPVVVFLAQRPGPSTCMPTWTEQGDLRFALHASQGEFLRVILAPGTVDEEFYLGAEAFNIAEKYQIPVIVMSDKFLSESHFSADRFEPGKVKIERGEIASKLKALKPMERFERYKLTKSGISPLREFRDAGKYGGQARKEAEAFGKGNPASKHLWEKGRTHFDNMLGLADAPRGGCASHARGKGNPRKRNPFLIHLSIAQENTRDAQVRKEYANDREQLHRAIHRDAEGIPFLQAQCGCAQIRREAVLPGGGHKGGGGGEGEQFQEESSPRGGRG
ncbi:MAG: 2-oxoacid:acceptor oxidoreductase family protein [Candidatus Micrarchaeota archaeon]|nr:2-oxoacid:acceptor oxidoreductase family protein [Candidatus Micrarchaeota archaeon]